MSDEECKCVCSMHRAVKSVQCGMAAQMTVVIKAMVIGDVPIEMCHPCGGWWLDTQLNVRQGKSL